METLHVHSSRKHDNLKSLLLLVPILIFGLVVITYLLLKSQAKNLQVATQSNPSLGTKNNESWVLGDQDNLDNTNP